MRRQVEPTDLASTDFLAAAAHSYLEQYVRPHESRISPPQLAQRRAGRGADRGLMRHAVSCRI